MDTVIQMEKIRLVSFLFPAPIVLPHNTEIPVPKTPDNPEKIVVIGAAKPYAAIALVPRQAEVTIPSTTVPSTAVRAVRSCIVSVPLNILFIIVEFIVLYHSPLFQ